MRPRRIPVRVSATVNINCSGPVLDQVLGEGADHWLSRKHRRFHGGLQTSTPTKKFLRFSSECFGFIVNNFFCFAVDQQTKADFINSLSYSNDLATEPRFTVLSFGVV